MTNFYEGPPTEKLEEGHDDWYQDSRLGRADLDENNDLSGGDVDDS